MTYKICDFHCHWACLRCWCLFLQGFDGCFPVGYASERQPSAFLATDLIPQVHVFVKCAELLACKLFEFWPTHVGLASEGVSNLVAVNRNQKLPNFGTSAVSVSPAESDLPPGLTCLFG